MIVLLFILLGIDYGNFKVNRDFKNYITYVLQIFVMICLIYD